MKRKQYIRKIQTLTLAVYKHPSTPDGLRIGEALKITRKLAIDVPKKFGSYKASWESDTMKWVRQFYGVN